MADPLSSTSRRPTAVLERLLRSKAFIGTLIVLLGLWPLWPIWVRPDPSVLADPLKHGLQHLGFVACVLLATVLTFTPLRVLFPASGVALALNRHRRLVGVAAFAYGALHFIVHLGYEGGTDPATLPEIFRTAVKKNFQLAGLITLAILAVLAFTSLNAFVRRLGARNWKNLHRLAYAAAALAAYHQAVSRKTFPRQVLWIFVPLALLELARIAKRLWAPAKSAGVS